jgi:phosphoadenosine phosphosulfate reductase
LDYNPLYDEDYERIGCYMCPAELGSEFENVKRTHAELYSKWMKTLFEFAKNAGLSEEYVTHGFWRWRHHPPKMRELAEKLSIDISKTLSHTKGRDSFIEIVNLGRFCETSNNWLIEGRYETKGGSFESIVEFLKTLGNVRFSEDLGVALVDMNGIREPRKSDS